MPILFDVIPSQVKERLSFLTEVKAARSSEQRESYRDGVQRLIPSFRKTPNIVFEIEARYRQNFIGEWYVPIYPDMSRLTASLALGSTSIEVEPGDYAAGGKAVILAALNSEVVDVVSLVDGTLTISATTAVHPAGAIVAPLATCLTPDGLRTSVSYTVETVEIEFLRTDNSDLASSSFPEVEGLPVLTDSTVIVSELPGGVARALELIDSAFGAYSLEARETYTRKRVSLKFKDGDRATRWARKRFMHYLRGRDHPFWLPSWRRDLVLQGSVGSGAISVAFHAFGSDADHQTLVGQYLEFAEGASVSRRKITSAITGAGSITYSLSGALGAAFTTAARVSVMRKMRLDTDEIELAHSYIGGSDFITEIDLNAIEVIG